MPENIKNLITQLIIETQNYSAQQLIKHLLTLFGDKIALATSFSAEDQVLTDMFYRISPNAKIFTLDTGRLPQESYQVMETTRAKYGIQIDVLFPDYKKVEEMVNQYGPNLFYNNIDARKLCCQIRKIEPLKRKLSQLQAWLCGLRTEQSVTRTALQRIEFDENFGLIKVSPLADWTTEQVWQYIRENKVPYNKLHDKGYTSIGCEPCTRAIKDGQDIRAGRWWWENPEHKECGLHLRNDYKNKKEIKS